MKLTLYADGGARGNPGPAASGMVLKNETGQTIAAWGEYLGTQTNNVAEYSALIFGLQRARELGADTISCIVDSKLVAEQLNGNWRVKQPHIQKLFVQAYNLMRQFKKCTIEQKPRAQNTEADREVNKTLDHVAKNPD